MQEDVDDVGSRWKLVLHDRCPNSSLPRAEPFRNLKSGCKSPALNSGADKGLAMRNVARKVFC
jgi:hypothetical protein